MAEHAGSEAAAEVAVAIVGAGAGGLALGVALDRAGVRDWRILERAGGVGGTWRANTYPGAACDVPSRLYSLSFAPKADWTRRFAPQPEILAYLEDVADRFGLRDRILLNAEVAGATWDAERATWEVRTAAGPPLRARVLVSAVGQLYRPKIPDLPGLADFEGATFHSARWNHDHDLSGRAVGVVGSGASAIQIVPAIADRTERVVVFQRSPHWTAPRLDRPFTQPEKWLLGAVPPLERSLRALEWLSHEVRWLGFRRQRSLMAAAVCAISRWSVRRQVADPGLRDALIPDEPLGCKRVLLTDDWPATMARDDVLLETSGIERVVTDGVVTRDGAHHRLDTLVFATGFHSTEFLSPMRIEGPQGTLEEVWAPEASAYLGMAVAGFPNLFVLYGPNTNLGHNSILFMLECQTGYVAQCVQRLRDEGLKWLEVRPEAQARFDAEVQAKLEKTVWAAGCHSWYKTESGRIVNNWSGSTASYWWRTRRPRWQDYAAV